MAIFKKKLFEGIIISYSDTLEQVSVSGLVEGVNNVLR